MSKLKIVFIASVVIMGLLVAFTVFEPVALGERFRPVFRESVIPGENEWIIQFDIINRESSDTSYTIDWSTGGEIYRSKVIPVKSGRMFTYLHHVYPGTVKEGKVRLIIYQETESTPFEDITYHITFD